MQVATDGIIAVGMTFIIVTAGIDLSVGKVVALTSVIAIGLQRFTNPALASGAALLAGLIIGIMNGLLVTKMGISPFISTLSVRVFVGEGWRLVSPKPGPLVASIPRLPSWR
ncbi:MAG: hypothetical protein GY832_26800 [Chloroflexi bacterium]|nr:hypothetical protein [Chloroflexota bacterium]